MCIKIIPAYAHSEEVKLLFSEYITMLLENDPSFKEYLDLQNYEGEIANLETKYGLPDGRLYLLYYEGEIAGCIGLKKIDRQCCEVKRLYVRPAFRGKELGRILVEKIIADAKEIGYSHMLLDTLPFLRRAIALYKNMGFYEVEQYNDSPMRNAVYMKLDL